MVWRSVYVLSWIGEDLYSFDKIKSMFDYIGVALAIVPFED